MRLRSSVFWEAGRDTRGAFSGKVLLECASSFHWKVYQLKIYGAIDS